MIHDPHVSQTLKGDVWYVRLQVRQERFCCFQQYWGLSRGDSGATREVVFCNHADHLISKAPSVPRQHVGVQMLYHLPSYSIYGSYPFNRPTRGKPAGPYYPVITQKLLTLRQLPFSGGVSREPENVVFSRFFLCMQANQEAVFRVT